MSRAVIIVFLDEDSPLFLPMLFVIYSFPMCFSYQPLQPLQLTKHGKLSVLPLAAYIRHVGPPSLQTCGLLFDVGMGEV